jgi:predicted O-methyltransferase YrrM
MAKAIINKIKRHLTLQIIKDYKKIEGWISPDEAIGLFSIAKRLGPNAKVVEIGSWQGKSTFCIAKGLKSGLVYAIDPFNGDGGEDAASTDVYSKESSNKNLLNIFLSNMKELELADKIIVKKGYSSAFASEFDSIDFLFIDGDHSIKGCTEDYQLYAGKIVKGGFIAFHDYYQDRPEIGPTHVVQQMIPKDGFKFYAQYDSLWIGVKK